MMGKNGASSQRVSLDKILDTRPLPGPKLPELEVPVGDSHEGPLNN
jgi:hypothetical protein